MKKNRVPVYVSLPDETYNTLKARSKEEGLALSTMARNLILNSLQNNSHHQVPVYLTKTPFLLWLLTGFIPFFMVLFGRVRNDLAIIVAGIFVFCIWLLAFFKERRVL